MLTTWRERDKREAYVRTSRNKYTFQHPPPNPQFEGGCWNVYLFLEVLTYASLLSLSLQVVSILSPGY